MGSCNACLSVIACQTIENLAKDRTIVPVDVRSKDSANRQLNLQRGIFEVNVTSRKDSNMNINSKNSEANNLSQLDTNRCFIQKPKFIELPLPGSDLKLEYSPGSSKLKDFIYQSNDMILKIPYLEVPENSTILRRRGKPTNKDQLYLLTPETSTPKYTEETPNIPVRWTLVNKAGRTLKGSRRIARIQ